MVIIIWRELSAAKHAGAVMHTRPYRTVTVVTHLVKWCAYRCTFGGHLAARANEFIKHYLRSAIKFSKFVCHSRGSAIIMAQMHGVLFVTG